MDRKKLRDIDAAIEDMLQGDRLRPAPLGLHRRIENRLQYVALQDRERRRFREVLAAGAAGTLAVCTTTALALWHLAPLTQAAAQTPGAMGHFDRIVVHAADSWVEIAGVAAFMVAAAVASAILLARPPRWFSRLLGR